MLSIGLTYGSILVNIDQFVAENEMFSKMLQASGGSSIAQSYIAMVITIGSLIATIPVLLCVNKLFGEEKRGRLEQVLSKSVSRTKLLASFIIIAVIEAIVFLSLQAIGYYLAAPSLNLFDITCSSLNYLTAVLTMMGVMVLLIGIAPKFISLIWAVFGFVFVVFYFGELFDIPKWLIKLSPFGNIPSMPVENFALAPTICLFLIAIMLTTLGIYGYKRRNIG